jgi:fibronectin-binding autotransporter adhesin
LTTVNNWDSNVIANFANAINFVGAVRLSPFNDRAAASVLGGINFNNTTGNAFNFSGNSLTLGGNITTAANTAGSTITDVISLEMILNGNRTITTNQLSSSVQHNLTVSGIISETGGARNLTKAGGGVLSLTGANTYTGTTTISGGTLDLGNGTADGSLLSTTLTLAGGALNYTRAGNTTQSFTTTNINGGGNLQISVVSGNTLDLGTVTRAAGGSYNFASTGGGTIAALTTNNDASGILPGFTHGDSWAVANGAGVAISALGNGSYTLSSVAGTSAAAYLGNINVDNSAGLIDGPITANSLRFSSAAANTLTLAAGTNTLTSGGILVGSGVGSNLSTITGGD